ncbi:Disease resistance protein Roq1 [Cardamine amara subsp. amara]|uniref:Disease resistance protein Roq1 n=1 Tax=Cardamine amara subsp. amara TaxID=228776 RepID=A0ABD1AGN4_CARAN
MAIAFYAAVFVFLSVLLGIRCLLARMSTQIPIPVPILEDSPTPIPVPILEDSSTEALEDGSSPSPSLSLWKYEVFLSFRGKDVRGKFISHLYKALTDEGIDTFYDDKNLRRGNPIMSGLSKAIEESRFAIIVISENYATSRWCLEELSLLYERSQKKLLKLIPISYYKDPADVKNRSQCIELALSEHEKKYDANTVGRWRNVMAEVAKISCWDSTSRNEESEFVEEIVKDLSERLFPQSSSGATELVGMSLHKKSMDRFLSMDSEDVGMVGVWGMGGRGKTTIAKYVFESLSNQFHSRCLLENVKGDFKQYGPSHLRKEIMSEILPKSCLNVRSINSDMLKQGLRSKKVLLVLDDVDDVQQLEELADCKWFGPGSRIIITTRDKRVLDQHGVKHIYEVKPLSTTQALQLFSKHAFKMNRPQKEFIKLSVDIVEQLGGLPLAVRVIGASLYRREIAFWEEKLLIIKNSLDKSISLALKVSYDALDDQEKIVFLYVAGCFNGEYKERAKKVLNPFVFSSGPSLTTLVEKSLISMSKNTRLWVHDLLQDMAKDIICEGKKEKPWKRKMLWKFSDVKDLFTENMVTKDIAVESILLNMAEETELCINPATFQRMFNLKFLKIHNNITVGGSKMRMLNDLDYLPPLIYLRWEAYTLKSLPSHFQTDYLVELNLPDSSIERLWSGTQNLPSLRHMNLNRCRHLIEIPDLSKAESLETLCLCDCESLVELHSSLWHLDKLVKLSMRNCMKLKNLPSNVNLNSLKTLCLDGCTNIDDFPFVSDKIEELGLSQTSIAVVPTLIERLSKLRELRLSQCKRLMNLPDTIGRLESLRNLWLGNCPNVTVFPVLGNGIETLSLNGTGIEEVPSAIGDKLNLIFLDMSECQRLRNLPPTLRNLKNLKLLYLRGCTNITELPQIAGEMRKLDLYGTSIEKYGLLSEDEALEMRNRDMEFVKGFLTRYVTLK